MTDSTIARLPSKPSRPTAPIERKLNQLTNDLELMFEAAQNACAIAESGAFIYASNDAGDKGVPDPKRLFEAIATLTASLVQNILEAKAELERTAS